MREHRLPELRSAQAGANLSVGVDQPGVAQTTVQCKAAHVSADLQRRSMFGLALQPGLFQGQAFGKAQALGVLDLSFQDAHLHPIEYAQRDDGKQGQHDRQNQSGGECEQGVADPHRAAPVSVVRATQSGGRWSRPSP